MKSFAGMIGLAVLTLFVVVEPSSCEIDGSEARARGFLARFTETNHTFDPVVAHPYADEARVMSVREYPNGTERTFEMNGAEYKLLIRKPMPFAKA